MNAVQTPDDGAEGYVSSAFRRENVGLEGNADEIRTIVEAGAHGAMALAGLSVATIIAIWFAFFLFIYLPRGTIG